MKKKKWLPILVVWLLLGGVAVWGLSQFVTEQIWNHTTTSWKILWPRS